MPDKALERLYLDSLLAGMPHVAASPVEPGESPDFVIAQSTSRIGIEVTRHVPEHVPGRPHAKEQDALGQRTMVAAEKLWYESQPLALAVSAAFLDHPALTKARVPALAGEIVEYLGPRVAGLDILQQASLRRPDFDCLPELHSLHALRVPGRSYGVWQAGEGGWVRQATEGDIRALVASKESKVPAYRARADEIWLLITLQHMDAGDVVEAPELPVGFGVQTAFDRVFMLDVISRRVVEIPVDHAV